MMRLRILLASQRIKEEEVLGERRKRVVSPKENLNQKTLSRFPSIN